MTYRSADQLVLVVAQSAFGSGCYDDQSINHIGHTLLENVKGQNGAGRGSAGWWSGPLQAGQW